MVLWHSVASAMFNACETAHTSRVHNDRCPQEACHTEYVTVCCREQEKREERQRLKEQGVVLEDDPDGVGSFDDGDPHTTNLYIGGHLLTKLMTRPPALARLEEVASLEIIACLPQPLKCGSKQFTNLILWQAAGGHTAGLTRAFLRSLLLVCALT